MLSFLNFWMSAITKDRCMAQHETHLMRNLLEQRRLEDTGRLGRAVAVLVEDVPAAEHKIVERRQRDHLADLGRPAIRPFSETDGAHLGQRADGLGQSFTDGDDAGNEGGADGAKADQEHTEFAASGSDVNRGRHKRELYQAVDGRR